MRQVRIEVLGVPVDCVDMKGALDAVEEMIRGDKSQAIIAVNPEKVIKASDNRELLLQLQSAGLLIPDGIGVVFAARLMGLGKLSRVPGSELMPEICSRAARCGYKIFLFGGSASVNECTVETLRNRYPGINIVGRHHGFVSDADMPQLIADINASGAEVLFVALGSPKQEQWMRRWLPQLNTKVCQGVGGTFDVLCGTVRRAPLAFRKIHLEWLFRLVAQPSRIARQTALPKFVYRVFITLLTGEHNRKRWRSG